MVFRRLLRVLDYAYLFLALVMLSSLLWVGAGLILIGMPLWFVSTLFIGFSDGMISIFAVYIAAVSGSVGLFWGWKRWRAHLHDEARRSQMLPPKK